MFQVDIKETRKHRQAQNWENAQYSNFENCINQKALDRVLKYTGLTFSEFVKKSRSDKSFARVAAMYVSKNSSRQGTKDESLIIDGLAKELLSIGVNIRNYGTDEKVPIRGTNLVLPRKEAKKKYSKASMLKSFDFGGEISSTLSIEGFAKVCIGSGGHQDNVLHEAADFIKWTSEYGNKDTIYVVLIDTDQKKMYDILKKLEKGKENLWVVNHKEIQQRLISLKKEN